MRARVDLVVGQVVQLHHVDASPTVTSPSNGSPVRPSKSTVWPDVGSPRAVELRLDLVLRRRRRRPAVATCTPRTCLRAVDMIVVVGQRRRAASSTSRRRRRSPSAASRSFAGRRSARSRAVWICSPRPRRRPAEMGLEDLADVHARGHAERVQHDVDRRRRRACTACPPRGGSAR